MTEGLPVTAQARGPKPELYIGLMSGTSMDGVDGVLVDFSTRADADSGDPGATRVQVTAHAHRPFPSALGAELLALNTPGPNELHRASLAGNSLVRVYAEVVHSLLDQARVTAVQVRAIAAHGQTLRHQPQAVDGVGYTLQLNQPALLAERCGIDVIADFRSRDLAAGGQAAPLVPVFHRAVFGRAGHDLAVLNIGGISNLSLLFGGGDCLGFDCGPGNALMDQWCQLHTGAPYDDRGRWAASGQVIAPLLNQLLAAPYFDLSPPKSTGRDLFNRAWLQQALSAHSAAPSWSIQDVQATLAALTVSSIAQSLKRYLPQAESVHVCGGGAYNHHLMQGLRAALPGLQVQTTETLGLAPEQVEAAAFAWLGWAHLHRVAGNVPSVTGAAGPRVLGALYPA